MRSTCTQREVYTTVASSKFGITTHTCKRSCEHGNSTHTLISPCTPPCDTMLSITRVEGDQDPDDALSQILTRKQRVSTALVPATEQGPTKLYPISAIITDEGVLASYFVATTCFLTAVSTEPPSQGLQFFSHDVQFRSLPFPPLLTPLPRVTGRHVR